MSRKLSYWTVLACWLWMPAWAYAGGAFADAVAQLKEGDFEQKALAISALESSGDPRTLPLLKAMAAGTLFYRKDDGRLVLPTEAEDGWGIRDALTGAPIGTVSKREIKKIGVNNALRAQLGAAIARLSLGSPDAQARLQAVRDMMKAADAAAVAPLRTAIARERDADVRQAMATVIALADVEITDEGTQLRAIRTLGDSLAPEAATRLRDLSAFELTPRARQAVAQALASIESQRKIYGAVETIFFGLSLGSVLLLAAVGLAITFGVMGVINMAHGELMMLGAYTTYVVQLLMPDHIDYSLFVAVPAAFMVAALVGVALERGVIRFLYGRPLETLLATFGISLILQQAVRTVFSPLNRTVETPSWMSGALEVNGALSFTYNRLYILAFSLLVFAGLVLILKKTTLGLKVRAVAQNRSMARALGVRSGRVDALTFGLGSGIAGVAGVALSQLTNVGPNLGQAYIIDSFMVVVFGGVGNLWGTLVGAMSLGVVNKLLEPWSGAVLAKILVLVLLILFIQKKPRGLFPQKGRAAEA